MKSRKKLFCLILALCLCFVLAMPAWAAEDEDFSVKNISNYYESITPRTTQSYVVAVTPVLQAKNHWCWAACDVMFGKQANPKTTKTQVDVVRRIYGDTLPDKPGTFENICYGATYVVTNGIYPTDIVNGKEYGCSYMLTDNMNFATLEYYFKNDKPLIGIFYSKVNEEDHAMLLYGTQFIDNESGSQQKVSFIDPDDAKRYTYKYSELLNGTYHNFVYYRTVY